MSITDDLDRLFPGHRAPERTNAWKAVKLRFTRGESVTGTVVGKSPFGVWVDLGVGFPALLEIVAIADLTPEQYRAGDWCPVDSEVTALVGGFRDHSRQIKLWQASTD